MDCMSIRGCLLVVVQRYMCRNGGVLGHGEKEAADQTLPVTSTAPYYRRLPAGFFHQGNDAESLRTPSVTNDRPRSFSCSLKQRRKTVCSLIQGFKIDWTVLLCCVSARSWILHYREGVNVCRGDTHITVCTKNMSLQRYLHIMSVLMLSTEYIWVGFAQ